MVLSDTITAALRDYVRNIGMAHPEVPWIATPFNSWEPNPFYDGPDVPHPDDVKQPHAR